MRPAVNACRSMYTPQPHSEAAIPSHFIHVWPYIYAVLPFLKLQKDEFVAGGVTFKAWDMGGHEAVRHVWDDFLPTAGGVVFVVDAADQARLEEAEEELSALARDSALDDVPIAVLFNKTDLPFSLRDEELAEGLRWSDLERRDGPVKCFRASVLRGTGYPEAFQWLSRFC